MANRLAKKKVVKRRARWVFFLLAKEKEGDRQELVRFLGEKAHCLAGI